MQRHDLWQQGENAHRARVEAAQQGAGSAHWLGRSGPPQAGMAPFLSTVDHELRRPLSLIVGYAELLQQRTERWADADVGELASEILASSRMMIRLLDDLTHFTQTGSDHLRMQPRWVEVGELLRQLFHSVRSRPGGHWIQVEQAGPLRAYLDPERLMQVVENLLSNARRYAPDRPVTIRAAGGSGGLRIEIVDEGPGISPEEQRRIWERGYRGATAVENDAHGSGLGLPLVKQLVELQGGTVGVRSRPGAGATFWFTLPAGTDHPARRSSSAAGERATDLGRSTQRGPRSVLVVDDDPAIREVVALALEAEGYLVSVATDGSEALQRLGQERPDVIVLDMMMPRLDGFQFAAELERRGLRAHTRLVIISAADQLRQKAMLLSPDSYVSKPFQLSTLIEKVGPAYTA